LAVIGGRAHFNGITFATNTHIVRGKLFQGNITISVRRLPNLKIFEIMDKVPFLRGISKLAKINYKWFFLILLLFVIPWDWLLPSDSTIPASSGSVWASLLFYGLLLIILKLLLKQLWQFHGAEHKAFNSYTGGSGLDLNQVSEASRVSDRCGTNLAVILFPMLSLLSYVMYQMPLLMFVLSLSLGYEIFHWSSLNHRLKPVYMAARFIQRYIVTAEPNEEQLRVAIATLTKAIECDQGLVG
jgi:uncharacterized protein YqhQ